MIQYPLIDPVAISLGPLKIHWYGLMYLIGFASAWLLGKKRAEKPHSPIKPEAVEDMIFYGAMGVILGGRIGYILFYNFAKFIEDPIMLIRVWEGGMSFHGGLLGVLFTLWLYARKIKCSMFELTDFSAPLMTIGLFAGRIGNFINSELWGRTTDVPWAMVFPNAGPLPRHPSQLYEAFLEGILLFIILWFYSEKPRPLMAVSALSILCYGVFRFFVEFYRMPDGHQGYLAVDWMTKGQLLSLPMIVVGAGLLIYAYMKKS